MRCVLIEEFPCKGAEVKNEGTKIGKIEGEFKGFVGKFWT
jgi:hypothetical protein